MRTLLPGSFAIAVLVALLGCYPGGPESAGELDLVATFHDSTHDFVSNHTYAMPDTVVDLSVVGGGTSSLQHTYDSQILTLIANNMQAYGYTRVTGTVASGTKPDVVVLVGGITVDNYSVWYPYYPWWGYWGWWGGWGWWGYGPGYAPIYPPVPAVTSYTTGTLVISMVDPAAVASMNQIPVPWTAAVNGIITGASVSSRLTSAINQAFIQSPYLKH